MSAFLGFGFSGYRSFNGEIQRIGPLGNVSLLAGANNCGKSNVLKFAHERLPPTIEKLRQGQAYTPNGLDIPTGGNPADFRFSIPVPTDDDSLRAWADELVKGKESNTKPGRVQSFLKELLSLPEFSPSDKVSWFDVRPAAGDRKDIFGKELLGKLAGEGQSTPYGPPQQEWQRLYSVRGAGGGDFRNHWIPTVLFSLLERWLIAPKVRLLHAFRQIAPATGSGNYEIGGAGLINELALHRDPPIHEQFRKTKFQAIQSFVREVTRVSDATLKVPFDRSTLHVELNGRNLPLANLGTGIHQVVLLAVAATLHDDTLMCLEEPELHLHG